MVEVKALKYNHTLYNILREISSDIPYDINIIGLDDPYMGMNNPFYNNNELYSKPFILYTEEINAFNNPNIITDKNYLGFISHIKNTCATITNNYGFETFHLPMSSKEKNIGKLNDTFESLINTDRPINLVAWGSWEDHNNNNFINRGGNEIDSLINQLLNLGLNINLYIKTSQNLESFINFPDKVTIINSYISDDELNELYYKCDLFLLPSKQVHSVSLTYAMSFGIPCIVSNGWGFDEYCNDMNSINYLDINRIIDLIQNRNKLFLLRKNTLNYFNINHSRENHINNFKKILDNLHK
jgi:glycosyltransferase involved in cell wall biosynthesis